MTRLDPSLQLRRLVVIKDRQAVYDESFHSGVNIIRGENSTGKSTIAELIFFSLGGDLRQWKDEAAACDSTYAEVLVNGAVATLRRDIGEAGHRPMSIFLGGYDEASAAAFDWFMLPFSRKPEKESFSQMMFRLLGIPEVPGEVGENLTMHQLLRLMYVDQMTQNDRIFRMEPQWDSPEKRQSVGDLMLGVFEYQVYEDKLTLREREKDFELVSKQLTGLFDVIDEVEHRMNSAEINDVRAALKTKRELMYAELAELRQNRFASDSKGEGLKVIAELRQSLEAINVEVSDLQLRIGELEFGIADADALINATEAKLKAIQQGAVAGEALGSYDLAFCPICYSALDSAKDGHCLLCTKVLDSKDELAQRQRMENELAMQVKESRSLQTRRYAEVNKIRDELAKKLRERENIRARFLSLTRGYANDADAAIDEAMRKIGYIDREIEDLDRKQKQADQIKLLTDAKELLAGQIAILKERISQLEGAARRRRARSYTLISRLAAESLSLDLNSEEAFTADSMVEFDFANDRVVVNGKMGYSASSLTVIRNSFHLAILRASATDKDFLYPRFLLMDNIEDKGMNQPRSQQFQRSVVELSRALRADHQIIFTTSMIAPDLEIPELTVGDHYTFSNKALRMAARRATIPSSQQEKGGR